MIASLRRIVKKDIVKVFSLTAISTIIKMAIGFVSVKLVSTLIGPAGIALLGQFNNFSAIFLTFSTGGINTGVTKYVAEYAASTRKVNLILRSAVWIACIMSLLCGITLIFGSSFFAKVILHDLKYTSIIVIFGCTIILYSFNSLFLSILNGLKEFRRFVTISILSSVVGLVFTATLAYYLGVYGALLSAVTFESIILIVSVLVIARTGLFRKSDFVGKFSKEIGRKLANYSLMAFISACTVPVSQLVIRSSIVEYSSLIDAGLWEAMNRLSAMYLLVITSSLSVYYLPRLSEIKGQNELRDEILSTYKIVVPILIFVTLLIFSLRRLIIQIVYNEQFQGMEELFSFQLIGDFFKISSWILAYQMLARSMTTPYIVTEILGSVLFISASIFLIRFYGNLGATIGYAITYFLYFLSMVVIFRKLIFGYEAE